MPKCWHPILNVFSLLSWGTFNWRFSFADFRSTRLWIPSGWKSWELVYQLKQTPFVWVDYTGLFISPSGISDPCGTVTGMVTPKGSMSTEGETLQVSVLPYRCSICAPLLTSEGSWQTFLAHAGQSRPMAPAGLFVSQRTGSHSAGISCTTHELFGP